MSRPRDIEAVYSPDDGGWYALDYSTDRTTAVYDTRGEALAAAHAERWDDP